MNTSAEVRYPRAGKDPGEDGLDDLMSFIEGEDEEQIVAALDPEVDEFINGKKGDEDGGEEELDAAGQPVARAPKAPAAAPAPAPAPAPPGTDAITQLAAQLLAREERQRQADDQARLDAEATRRNTVEPAYDPATLALTSEEEAQYAASRPVIEKLVRAELNRYHATSQPRMAQTLEELRQQISSVQPAVARSTDAAFAAVLRAQIPDLDTRVKTPEWQAYLAAPVPYRGGATFGQLLHQAVNETRDVELALEIVRGFTPPVPPKAPTRAAAPGQSRGGAPASVAASVKRGGDQPTMLPYSKFEAATELMSKGKMDPGKYQKIADAYMDAHEAGLVDYAT